MKYIFLNVFAFNVILTWVCKNKKNDLCMRIAVEHWNGKNISQR